MELEKSMIKRFSFSSTAIFFLLGMMLLDSLGLYFALDSVKSINAGIIWYGVAILLLVASLSTGFSITLIYHSSALAYYLRFSKLKMYNYVLSLFLGPNGSGKMTLLRAISGIIPYKDSIKING